MAGTGHAVVDFGSGADHADVVITGQSGILTSSFVEAWIDPTQGPTVTRTVDELVMVAALASVVCSLIVPDVGFTVTMISSSGILFGEFTVSYAWT